MTRRSKRDRIDSSPNGYSRIVGVDFPMPGGPDREFFMRKCYETFYRLITDRMETESRYVTVTGSHGVGKSVFMQYFCQRFRNENPTVTIICVAFDDCSRVQESRVIYPASLPQLMNPTVPIIAGNVLYVYDGPPFARTGGSEDDCLLWALPGLVM